MTPRPHGLIRQAQQHTQPWMLRSAAVALTVTLLAASAPLLWSAVAGGLSLLVLVGLALVGAAVFQALPWAFQRLENQLLRWRKAEARTNPIEQLQNEVLRRAEGLTAFRRALAMVGGQIESIEQMIAERRHADPAHVLDRQQRALQRLSLFHSSNLVRLGDAQAALDDFARQVEQKRVEWDMSLLIEDALEGISPQAGGQLMQNLLTDEALRSVQSRFNTVFAELDLEMRAVDAPTRAQLADSPAQRPGGLTLPTGARTEFDLIEKRPS